MMWLVSWWRAALKERPIADITAAEVRALIDARHARAKVRGAKGGRVTSNRLLSRFRHIFNWSIERGYATTSPFHVQPGQPKLRIVKAGVEAPRTRRLREGEEAKVLKVVGGDLKMIVLTLLDTALRIGELTALTFADVDLKRSALMVRAETAKTSTAREVPMTARVKAIVESRATAPDGQPHPPSAFVFGTVTGEFVHPDAVRRAWDRTCEAAGVHDLHLHDLRREAASRLLEAGVPLHTISRWLGHTSVTQTATYLSVNAAHLHDAARLLEASCNLLANSAPPPPPPQTDAAPQDGENQQIH